MRICVFCGSSTGRGGRYADAARELGRLLAERGIGLVYGGASVGTMGEVADAALAAGGEVTGVIPRQLVDRELAHPGLSDLHVVADMHERKARMARYADAFVALPGGAGTLEELFEVWTWGQLGLHAKPLALLDVAGYYQPLRAFVDHMVAEEFLHAPSRDMLIVETDPSTALDRIAAYEPPAAKWGGADPSVESAANPLVHAIAWVHTREGRMLAARTGGNELFYLPGGKPEPGESDAEAVAREVKEEVSVTLRPDTIRPFTVIDAAADGYPEGTRVRLACYLAEHDGEPAATSEIAELAWLGHGDRFRCAPGVARVIEQLHERGLVG